MKPKLLRFPQGSKPLQTQCKTCGRIIYHRRGTKTESGKKRIPVHCSYQCAGIAKRKRKQVSCQHCKHVFEVLNCSKRKFCSHYCSGFGQRGKNNHQYKTESIRTNGYTGNTDVWVKDETRKTIWRRKATVVLEEVLKRKLRGNELTRVVYIDGNRLNCSPENLYLGNHSGLLVCKSCGKSRRLNQHAIDRHGEFCQFCRGYPGNRKLSARDVSVIKAVIKSRVSTRRTKRGVNACEVIASWFRVTGSNIICIERGKTWKKVRAMAKKDLWKALLEQHDKLRKQSGVTLYDRVTLLAKVYEDPQFVVDMKADGKSHVEELDKRVSDTCANFTELLQMLKLFPQKRQWSGGDLSAMRLKMLDKLRGEQKKQKSGKGGEEKDADNGRHNRRVATIAQVNERDAEIERLRTELETSGKLIKSLEMQLETMRDALETSQKTINSLDETIKLTQKQIAPKRKRSAA